MHIRVKFLHNLIEAIIDIFKYPWLGVVADNLETLTHLYQCPSVYNTDYLVRSRGSEVIFAL